jgi:hypothetical protein
VDRLNNFCVTDYRYGLDGISCGDLDGLETDGHFSGCYSVDLDIYFKTFDELGGKSTKICWYCYGSLIVQDIVYFDDGFTIDSCC